MNGLSIDLSDGSPAVLHVGGELDALSADQFSTAYEEAVSAHSTVVVDMAELAFIDAAGLRAILRASECRNGADPLTLVNAPRVAWLFRVVGLEGLSSIDFVTEGDRVVG
jgi:anti-anti-sigma factor